MSTGSTGSTLTVVLGPKTRFGRALVDRLGGEPLVLVARDDADAAELRGLFAGVTVATGAELADAVRASGADRVRLVVAALGPVHPVAPAYDADAAGVARDLGLVRDILAGTLPVHVVLVSTILALAPGEDRRYYGGWKGVVEQQLRQLAEDRQAAGTATSLSVLYPGRLTLSGSGLHASYSRLVDAALRIREGQSRIVGLDTRIWLLVRSISFALRSLKA